MCPARSAASRPYIIERGMSMRCGLPWTCGSGVLQLYCNRLDSDIMSHVGRCNRAGTRVSRTRRFAVFDRLIIDWRGLKKIGWPISRAHTWRLMFDPDYADDPFPRCRKLGKQGTRIPCGASGRYWPISRPTALRYLKTGISLTGGGPGVKPRAFPYCFAHLAARKAPRTVNAAMRTLAPLMSPFSF